MAPNNIAVHASVNMEDLMQSMAPMTKQHSTVRAEQVEHEDIHTGFKVGDFVQAIFSEDGQTHHAFVLKNSQDGTYQVRWQDAGLGLPEESPVSTENMKYPPISLDKLKVGQKYTGVVRSITDFGAFVDIGAVANGLLHKSSITKQRVKNVHDFLREGEQVEVWISRLQGDGKFGLTMMKGNDGRPAKPDLSPFLWVSPEDWFEGTVHNMAPFGAFVTITLPTGETADGLVHKSQITNNFVQDVAREVKIGQKVQVRVVSVEPQKNKMFFSMKLAPEKRSGRSTVDFSAFERIPSTQWMRGKVSQITDFGAFVTVATPDGKASTDGLVHITQIKAGFIESVEAELQKGQEVQVRIYSLDVAKEKLRLTMLWDDK